MGPGECRATPSLITGLMTGHVTAVILAVIRHGARPFTLSIIVSHRPDWMPCIPGQLVSDNVPTYSPIGNIHYTYAEPCGITRISNIRRDQQSQAALSIPPPLSQFTSPPRSAPVHD
ncbi:hypothetical protein J6590_008433 [Homalodisca vitripennis]|nr:hypothetical protein J6590_008433 [Homalodisca vitripennis]